MEQKVDRNVYEQDVLMKIAEILFYENLITYEEEIRMEQRIIKE